MWIRSGDIGERKEREREREREREHRDRQHSGLCEMRGERVEVPLPPKKNPLNTHTHTH